MTQAKQAVPPGFHSVTPQFVVSDGPALIDFLGKALGFETMHVMPGPGGKGVMHGAVRLGDSIVFVSDQAGFSKPTTNNHLLYVADVDAAFERAVKNGAKPLAPPSDMFWGDRWSMVEDPFGNQWQIAARKEDVSPEEMGRRIAAMAQGQK